MVDIAGFVGVIYQAKQLNEIAIAGEAVHTTVNLPRTRATLMAFLEGDSLAIMWNYITHLEAQGQLVSDAKDLHEVNLEKAKIERAKRGRDSSDTSQGTEQKRFRDNLIPTPSKKKSQSLGRC
ncbi:hypothetical protein BGZ73_002604 [Actinomortierella ambigua]|nr:hypothetical protein BGZ73_002604 [Actinomortierella ambigua]